MTDPTDDFFAELEAVISTAAAKGKLKSDAAVLKKTSHNMRISPERRAAAAAEFRSIQAIVEANEWRATQVGAMFTEQLCDGCGSIHYNFLQFMLEEVKVRDQRSRRWVRIALPPEGLARTTIIQPLKTHLCSDCCDDHGFDAKAPQVRLLPREDGLTVSATYLQGDINGNEEEA